MRQNAEKKRKTEVLKRKYTKKRRKKREKVEYIGKGL